MIGRFDRLFRWLRPFALVAAAVGLFFALWAQRDGVAEFPWRVSWPRFVLAVPLFAVGPIVGAASFWLIARAVAGGTRFLPSTHVWMRSFVARYVPSGALTLAVRVGGRDRLGASPRQVVSATLYEQLAAALGGAAAATVALLAAEHRLPLLAAALLAGLIACTVVGPRLTRLPRRTVAAAALVNCAGWLVTGTAAWILVGAMVPSAPSLPFVTGVYALAWLVGFLIVFAPSGLGVREATLVALLAPRFGAGPATAIALVLRFANIVGELIAFGATELVARRWPAVAVAPQPPGALV